MAINLWYDYFFSDQVINNLLDEKERFRYHVMHRRGEVPNQKQMRHNAILPNILQEAKVSHNVIPAVTIRSLFDHDWTAPQFFPIEFTWWKQGSTEFNFNDSLFLRHGKPNTEFLIWFPTEAVDVDEWSDFENIHKRFPNYKIRFVHGNLKTPFWTKNKPYLTYKGFDYFWYNEQNFDRLTLDINREESATFSFYNNRHKLHRAIPYYRLLQYGMLENSDSSFNGVTSKEVDFNAVLKFYKNREALFPNTDADYISYYYDKSFKDWCISKASYENKYFHVKEIRDKKLNSLAYLDVIAETHAIDREDHFFITEKTYRPIARGCIFLILGHKGTLAYLKSKGIETFDDLFDESYDETTHWFNRWKIIERNIKIWLDLGPSGRKQYYKKNFDKLVHNQNVLYSRDFKPEIEELFK